MAKATWNGKVIAESDVFEEVEGNVYFPPDALKPEFFQPSKKKTVCPWKGEASYFNVEVNGKVNPDAAWTYREPSDRAQAIKNYVAFWGGVDVEK